MSCSNIRDILYNYISAYVDNELSDTDRRAIERHLEVCAHCANERFQIEQTRNRLHSGYAFATPFGVKENIQKAILETTQSDMNLPNVAKGGFSWRWAYYIVPPVVTAVAAVFLVLALLPQDMNQESMMEQEIVSAHVRSMMEDNLTHVDSEGSVEIKPWFNNRVDFVAHPEDLSNEGFYLKGGRLDYLNKHNAASLVYQTDDHIINLFIFPTTEADMKSFKNFQNRGYNIVKWTNKGLEYCVISDLNMDELNQFARVYREKISSPN